MKTQFSLLSLVLAFALFLPSLASSQVVVYRLEFRDGGESINYRPYLGGYYVAPAEGGQGTMLLQQVNSSTERVYQRLDEFGEVFVAVDGRKRRMVLSAMAANEVSTLSFLVLGELDREVKAGGTTHEVANSLKGQCLAADSESDLPFFGFGGDSGVAAICEIKALLQNRRTREANKDGLSVEEVVDGLVAFLEREGYTAEATPAAGAGAGAGAAATATTGEATP